MPYQILTQVNYGEAIKTICRMVGHPIPNDPAGSTDPAVQQMGAAVNFALASLLTMAVPLPEITKPGEILVIQDQAGQVEKAFALPEDFNKFLDQSQWNASMKFPAVGPISPQTWMTYKVWPVVSMFTLTWQMREGKIWFLNPPADPGQTFAFMYLSNALVIDADDPNLLKNQASKNGDTFVIDGLLVALFGRLKYTEWKGFDSTAAASDFWTAYDNRAGTNKGAPILMAAQQPNRFPLVGIQNLPDTRYGGIY